MKHLAVLAMAALFGLHSPGARAQSSYPSKPIKLVVPVTTGGPSDLVARILGDRLATSLDKPVVVENRPGAWQSVGAAVVAEMNRWKAVLGGKKP